MRGGEHNVRNSEFSDVKAIAAPKKFGGRATAEPKWVRSGISEREVLLKARIYFALTKVGAVEFLSF